MHVESVLASHATARASDLLGIGGHDPSQAPPDTHQLHGLIPQIAGLLAPQLVGWTQGMDTAEERQLGAVDDADACHDRLVEQCGADRFRRGLDLRRNWPTSPKCTCRIMSSGSSSVPNSQNRYLPHASARSRRAPSRQTAPASNRPWGDDARTGDPLSVRVSSRASLWTMWPSGTPGVCYMPPILSASRSPARHREATAPGRHWSRGGSARAGRPV